MHIIMEYVMLEGMERESVWEREREKGRGEVEVEVEVGERESGERQTAKAHLPDWEVYRNDDIGPGFICALGYTILYTILYNYGNSI